ncbi:aureocin A53 family class IId bacteriocin [Longispora albida]|uniref:aureocin A53 family class IId bacteriocin n=1 Tax=Longispora albida TaxID=203523 RepID=UPI0003687A00|nr:aureocin A53 family class IId bacteriocin [Longispora albida]
MKWIKIAWQLIKAGAKYGKRFADWVWANKGTILRWISAGYSISEIVLIIARLLGLA